MKQYSFENPMPYEAKCAEIEGLQQQLQTSGAKLSASLRSLSVLIEYLFSRKVDALRHNLSFWRAESPEFVRGSIEQASSHLEAAASEIDKLSKQVEESIFLFNTASELMRSLGLAQGLLYAKRPEGAAHIEIARQFTSGTPFENAPELLELEQGFEQLKQEIEQMYVLAFAEFEAQQAKQANRDCC